ncbi:succinate dehydrogenase [uncultured Roseovarius sp.]|uniref:succinate dehydrogenase n=1 Tax=uncultured Roseovarius sp. TaxID=293344 RepID=UPI002606D2E5|nr:succinate dehydrogenase [uncultured Roseovarius sp.]
MRMLLATVALLALGACEATNQVADTIARERAKSVVNTVVAERFPAVNAAPVTDCIIDAASAREIVRIAGASVTGVTPEVAQEIVGIAQRPEAVQCIAANSLTLLGG